MILDKTDIEQFQRDGVVLLRNALDNEQMDALFKLWEWSCENPGPAASGFLGKGSFQDLCNTKSRKVYEPVLRELPLASYAQQLWGGGSAVWYMYEQVFSKPAQGAPRTPWHQDTSYYAVNGSNLIAFWISFDSILKEDSLEYVRGSSNGPLFNTSLMNPKKDLTIPNHEVPEDHPGYLPRLPDIEANRDDFDIVSFATEPGDIVAFHTSTLHGGGGTSRETPQRRTLTLRFFGEDCQRTHCPGPPGPFGRVTGDLAIGEPLSNASFYEKICDAV